MSLARKLAEIPGKEIDYAIDLKDVSKSFRRSGASKGDYTTIKSWILNPFGKKTSLNSSETRAVRDLTIRIPQGSSIGIIGRNGSGKSTLLKLITGIYKPDSGSISVKGRVAALIELGAGFHPDFTGRENLLLGGVMYGLSRKELDERFDEIVDFAELRDVIDEPVRTYSSGMYMRLGFSLAIHTDPDVLLIDEVLAVGDAAFVGKCKEQLLNLRKKGTTLLLVSHDLDAIERWSDEVVWLHAGVAKDRGEPRRVIDHYREFIERGEESDLREEARIEESLESHDLDSDKEEELRWGSREIELVHVNLLDSRGEERLLFHPEDAVTIQVEYQMREKIDPSEVVFGIGIHRGDGLAVHGSNTDIERIEMKALKSFGRIEYRIKRLSLLEGSFTIDVAVHRKDGYPFDYRKSAVKFAVRSQEKQIGVILPEHTWVIS